MERVYFSLKLGNAISQGGEGEVGGSVKFRYLKRWWEANVEMWNWTENNASSRVQYCHN